MIESDDDTDHSSINPLLQSTLSRQTLDYDENPLLQLDTVEQSQSRSSTPSSASTLPHTIVYQSQSSVNTPLLHDRTPCSSRLDTPTTHLLEGTTSSVFSMNIIDIDHYTAPPIPHIDISHSDFTRKPLGRVPIVRLHGVNNSGQRICMHVHNCFPYLYVEVDEDAVRRIHQQMVDDATRDNIPPPESEDSGVAGEALEAYCCAFGEACEEALQIDLRGKREKFGWRSHAKNNDQGLVYSVQVLKAHKYYGYHHQHHRFIKVSLYVRIVDVVDSILYV